MTTPVRSPSESTPPTEPNRDPGVQTARPYYRDMSIFERLNRFIDTSTDCWLWTGNLNIWGYASIGVGGKSLRAHRVSYEMFVGPIPSDKPQLDHLCRTPACVRPDHLEPVTNRENSLRGVGITAICAKKTHCTQGHALTPENVYIRKQGWRACRTCNTLAERARKRELTNGD